MSQELYQKVKEYLQKHPNARVQEACEKFGIAKTQYYDLRAKDKDIEKKPRKKKSGVIHITTESHKPQKQESQKIFCFYGDPKAIFELMQVLK